MIRVLIVEDDPMVVEINKEYLGRIAGFKLIGTVANGNAALQFIRNNSVELLLLDVFMPQMDGLLLLKEIKREFPLIDVIMITAAQTSDNIQLALSYGVVDYIIKPFKFDRLALALRAYQERVHLLQENDSIEQAALDKKIFIQMPKEQILPKGIERQTLALIKTIIAEQAKPFSTQDLSALVGISRISLRKYLTVLEKEGFIQSTLTYRQKGRPVNLYNYIKPVR